LKKSYEEKSGEGLHRRLLWNTLRLEKNGRYQSRRRLKQKGLNKKGNKLRKDVAENSIQSRIRIRSLNLAVFTQLSGLLLERGGDDGSV